MDADNFPQKLQETWTWIEQNDQDGYNSQLKKLMDIYIYAYCEQEIVYDMNFLDLFITIFEVEKNRLFKKEEEKRYFIQYFLVDAKNK